MKKKILKLYLPIVLALAICCGIGAFYITNDKKMPADLPSTVSEDVTAPVITLKGDNTFEMEAGETIHLPEATATDDVDGDLTEQITQKLSHGTQLAQIEDGHFTTKVGGCYKVLYHVSDEAGNEATETVEITVHAKTQEKALDGTNDLSVLNTSGSLFYENFEKGPENELLNDNFEDHYTLTGMEDAISGNSLVVDYGSATDSNRVTLLSLVPYLQSGTWEISFDVKLVEGEGRDDFYIMYTPNVDKNVYYSERLLLADMKKGEVRHISYKKVLEVLDHQEGTATFFLCNSSLDCGDITLMFDNFQIRRTDLEYETYVPTVEELEKGFTYDWSEKKYATLGEVMTVNSIEDAQVREALKGSEGFSDKVMKVTNDSVLNGILAANDASFYEQGREYIIEINYYVKDCQDAALMAFSGSTNGRGIRENLFIKRNEADSVTLHYRIGRGEEELAFYLFGYPAEVYIGDITLKLQDRTDIEREDYHILTEEELYAGYTFDFSKNNLPMLSSKLMYLAHYKAETLADILPAGYFKSGYTTWINGDYDLNLDFLNGLLKPGRTYDVTFRFYADRKVEMEKIYLLTTDAEGKTEEKNRWGIKDLGNGMYELYTQFMIENTETTATLYTTQIQSLYLDSIDVSMQDTKPIVELDDGILKSYQIDFDKNWLRFSVKNSNAGYVKKMPGSNECGMYVDLYEIVYFPQLQGFKKGKSYVITFTTKNAGSFGKPVAMFVDGEKQPTGTYVEPVKMVDGTTVTYQYIFTADETTKMFSMLNATPESKEKMYITDVEIFSADADSTTLEEICSENGYVSDFDKALPAMHFGQWTTMLPSKYQSSQKYFYHVDLQNSESFAMDYTIFDGLVKKGYYYTLSMTGFLEEDSDVDVRLLPMDKDGNYTTYYANRQKLSDGQTKITFCFNGGDYDTGRICEYLRLFSISGKDRKFDMYISQISLKAVDYKTIKTGKLDTGANKIIFPNIYEVSDYSGNAEAVIILNNGQVALIDAGEIRSETSKFTLYKKLKELGVSKIDTVIMTHPHSDHCGAFTMLAEYFDIGSFYCKNTCWTCYENTGGGEAMAEHYHAVLKCMQNKVNTDKSKVKINTNVMFGDKIAFGNGGEFVFYYAKECFGEELAQGEARKTWDGNYFSLGVRYNTASGYDTYFAGDSVDLLEGDLLKTQFENCEIWQINHHGSDGPYTTNRQISYIDPVYAVLCGNKDNLKPIVKERIESCGNIEIKYPCDGDVVFDLNTLIPQRGYRSLTESELYAGHTFDLSKDNLPRVTTSHPQMDLKYLTTADSKVSFPDGYFVNGTAIQADGRYMVNLDFLNGLIKKGRTYDLKFTVYAPKITSESGGTQEGISRGATYLEVKDAEGRAYGYYRFGYTALGNDMYELYIQISCQDEESVFALYSDVEQTYYIEKIEVSMKDSLPFAKIDQGITKKYDIDLSKEWLKFSVRNSNAGYRKLSGTDDYALYVKLEEILCFSQLTGFTEGLEYQISLTGKYSGSYSDKILGMFLNEQLEQSGAPVTPVITASKDTVTYTFTFTADQNTKTFGLYDSAQSGKELYLTNVKIVSEKVDKTSLEEICSAKGFASDFDAAKIVLTHGEWTTKSEIPGDYHYQGTQENFYHIDLASATDFCADLSVFNGLVQKGYYYTLTLTGFFDGAVTDAYLLPMAEGANYATYTAVSETLADGQTKLTYYFNGGDYYHGKTCELLRLYGKNGANTKFDLYLSKVTMKAVAYDTLTTGTLDKTANKIIFPNLYTVDDYQGQAESVIILNNGSVALIDSGENASETSKFILLSELKKLGVTKIDVVILTHPHSDHYGALTMLAEYFDIGAYYCKDTDWTTYESTGNGAGMEQYFDAIAACMENKVNTDGTKTYVNKNVQFQDSVSFGDHAEFVFYYARKCFGENLAAGETRQACDGNYFSLAIRYNTKSGYDAYFAGDSPATLEGDLLTVPFDNCEIWQINHHGSSGPYTTARSVELFDPEYAVVCGNTDNLKDDVKNYITTYGSRRGSEVTICYGSDGVEFDLTKLSAKKTYKAVTEAELTAENGYTYTLEETNLPRITSYELESGYVKKSEVSGYPASAETSASAIKVSGIGTAYLQFMNGLVEPGKTYDVTIRIYAPNGVSRNDIYLQTRDISNNSVSLRRVGFTDLGNGMYDLYGQVRCQSTESQLALYLGNNRQTYYIDKVTVAKADAKAYALLDDGITQDYSIDLDKEWLDVKVINANAGYRKIPGTDTYGLYTKLDQSLIFESLTGFTAGRTYQLTFTAASVKNCGPLYGLRYVSDTSLPTLYGPVTPKTLADGTISYTFTFTAPEDMKNFVLYSGNTSSPEMYIRSVEIESYAIDTVTKEQVNSGTGYTSDFANKRLKLDVNATTHVNYTWDKQAATLDASLKGMGGLILDSFNGLFEQGSRYGVELVLDAADTTLYTTELKLLQIDASKNAKGEHTFSNPQGTVEGEMVYKTEFTVTDADVVNLELFSSASAEKTLSIKSVTVYRIDMVDETTVHDAGGYVSDFAAARLGSNTSSGSGTNVWEKDADGNLMLHVTVPNLTGLSMKSISGVFRSGVKYYLELEVEQIQSGMLLMLPMDANGNQLKNNGSGITYNVNMTSAADGIYKYTTEFTAPEGMQYMQLFSANGQTNEIKIKKVSLRGLDLSAGAEVLPTEELFQYIGGSSTSIDPETGILKLEMMGTNGTTNSFSLNTFDHMIKAGKKYTLTMTLTSDANVNADYLYLLGQKAEESGFATIGRVTKATENGELTYRWNFTAGEAYPSMKLYCGYSTTSTVVMQMNIKSVILKEEADGE